MRRFRGTKVLPEAHVSAGTSETGDVLVITKRNQRKIRRELSRRSRRITPRDITALEAAEAKRATRRARNLEAAR